MTSGELITLLKATLQKTKVDRLAEIAGRGDFATDKLIDITFHAEEQIAFRAAWILENVYVHYPERFSPHVIYFLERFHEQKNPSCRRHFAKILALMTAKKASTEVKVILNAYSTDALVETVFAWLIDEDVQVAIKSHCLNILANLSLRHDWIKDELTATMDFLVDKESIAFYAKVKQIRKQLK